MAAPLRELADELGIRNPAVLYRAAKKRHIHATLILARTALETNVGRQVFGPPVRSLGKSAAEGPWSRLQGDLIDFKQNADNSRHGHHYILLLVDVFDRTINAKTLPDKTPETVNAAMRELLGPEDEHPEDNFTLTTDAGQEFCRLQEILPANCFHKEKDPSDRNAIAVCDRAIQTVKKDLAVRIANRGGDFHSQLEDVVKAYNARPQAAVHGPPEDVENHGLQEFKVYQDNANRFEHNEKLYARRAAEVERTGAFREAVQEPFHRSFKPAWGPVRPLQEVLGGREFVLDDSGRRVLLKHVKAINSASGEPVAAMTTPSVKKADLEPLAKEIHEWLSRAPQTVDAVNARWGAQILNLRAKSAQTLMKMFPELFAERNGRWHALVLSHPPGPMLMQPIRRRAAGEEIPDAERPAAPSRATGAEMIPAGRRITRSVAAANPGLAPR